MSQAEIAGRAVTLPNELPSEAHRLHDFGLISAVGRLVQLSDYRSCSNLVLIFTDGRAETKQLLFDAVSQYTQIKNKNAEVLAAVRSSQEQVVNTKQQLRLPYPVLADEEGHIHPEVGAIDQEGYASAAVYVADQFGEVVAVYRARDGQELPTVADILNWLEFVNSQCSECEPAEWPV